MGIFWVFLGQNVNFWAFLGDEKAKTSIFGEIAPNFGCKSDVFGFGDDAIRVMLLKLRHHIGVQEVNPIQLVPQGDPGWKKGQNGSKRRGENSDFCS